jgi:hypothetical protein
MPAVQLNKVIPLAASADNAPAAPPKPPVIPLRMTGIVEDGDKKLAFMEDITTQRGGFVQVGDTIKEAHVMQIEKTRVTLQKDGFNVVLPLVQGGTNLVASVTQSSNIVPLEPVTSAEGTRTHAN